MQQPARKLGHRHTIHDRDQHLNWDNARKPALTAAPGDTIEFENIDATCGQITAKSTADTIRTLDFARVNPIAGPVYIDGAEPGDALAPGADRFDGHGRGPLRRGLPAAGRPRVPASTAQIRKMSWVNSP